MKKIWIGLLALLGGVLGGFLAGRVQMAHAEELTFGRIVALEYVLQDEDGKEVAKFASDHGNVTFFMGGGPSIMLNVSNSGLASISVQDENDSVRSLTLYDKRNKAVSMNVFTNGDKASAALLAHSSFGAAVAVTKNGKLIWGGP